MSFGSRKMNDSTGIMGKMISHGSIVKIRNEYMDMEMTREINSATELTDPVICPSIIPDAFERVSKNSLSSKLLRSTEEFFSNISVWTCSEILNLRTGSLR